jgi:hypothetical protein
MGPRSDVAIVVAVASIVIACQPNIPQQSNTPRILTSLEMEHLTAGSSTASIITPGDSQNAPVLAAAGMTGSKAPASAHEAGISASSVSTGVSIRNEVGSIQLNGSAAAVGSAANTNTQLYAISTRSADIVFGSSTAVACCAPEAKTDSNILTRTSGLYTSEIRSSPAFYTSDHSQSRVDVSVVISTMPISGVSLPNGVR